jgi:hypothetical protein
MIRFIFGQALGLIIKERKEDIKYIVHRKYTRWKENMSLFVEQP